MWLFNSKDDDKVIYLKSNSENVVGRNFGDVVFPKDKSVSRKHATICINAEEITIEDHGSTYGTYLNHGISQQKRIDPDVKVGLNVNDTLKFGMLGSEWTLHQLRYTTCLSTVKEENTKTLKAQLQDLGVTISKDWHPGCTHLTMPTITLTLKMVLALVHLRPIVTPEFWAESLRRRGANLPLPTPEGYLPGIKESALNQQANFHIDRRRSTLFEGKNFIFFSCQQQIKYKCIIEAAGGKSCFLRDCKMTNAQLCAASSIVVQYAPVRSTQDSQNTQSRIDGIVKYMASKKCRVIPESEIGLAILYVSIEKNCNPSFNFTSLIIEKQDNVNTPTIEARVLAPETEEISETQCSRRVAPSGRVQETLTSLASDRSADISQSSATSKDCSGFLEKSFLKSENSGVQKIKAPPPGLEEPPSKRKSVRNISKDSEQTCTEIPAPEKNTLFQFIEETPRPGTSKTSDNLQLTIQSGKRKRAESPCKEEDLFNFVPDVVGSVSRKEPVHLQLSPLKKSGDQTEITLNLRKNVKRKFDGSDNVDGKRSNINKIDFVTNPQSESTNTTPSVNIKEKLDASSGQWMCKKQFMISHLTVKKEESEGSISSETSAEDEVLLKLKELDLQPAIVEINNDLIVRRLDEDRNADAGLGSVRVSFVDGKKNFKKFSKVKPLRPHTEIFSSDMLVVYEGKTNDANLEKFMNVNSDEEEGNDKFDSFMSIGRQKPAARGRSRRL